MIAAVPAGSPTLTAGIIEPEQVADAVLAALATDRFMILPHPEVAEFARRRAAIRSLDRRHAPAAVEHREPGSPRSAVAELGGRQPQVLDLDQVLPAVWLAAVDVGDAVDARVARWTIPCRRAEPGPSAASAAIPRPTYDGVSEMQKCGVVASASRQFCSVTPKCSSIRSDRSQPGVTVTAVVAVPTSSAVRPMVIRSTVALTRS